MHDLLPDVIVAGPNDLVHNIGRSNGLRPYGQHRSVLRGRFMWILAQVNCLLLSTSCVPPPACPGLRFVRPPPPRPVRIVGQY